MKITTVGIDLAKNVFQVHGVDERGKAVLKKQLRRDQMATFFVNLPPCLIGMEACSSAHHWARKLQGMGHTVRLMALSSSSRMSKATRTMQPTRRPSAKQWAARTCASFPSRMSSNRPCSPCTECAKVS